MLVLATFVEGNFVLEGKLEDTGLWRRDGAGREKEHVLRPSWEASRAKCLRAGTLVTRVLSRTSRLLIMCWRSPILLLTVCNQTSKLILSKRKSEEIVESVSKGTRAFNEVFFLNQISLAKRLLSFYS